MKCRFAFLLFFILFKFNIALSQYSLNNLPDPKQFGQNYFVSNPDNILSFSEVDSLNKICTAIEKGSSAEVAIVIINDFEGGSDFEFAYNLFNHWGIGKKETNNGLLVFIAKNRRHYQFITGRGMEGTLPDVALGTIGENLLVPHFKENDYGGGIIASAIAIKNILLSPDSSVALKSELRKFDFWYKYQSVIRNVLAILAILLGASWWNQSVGNSMGLKRAKGFSVLNGMGCFAAILLMVFVAFLFIGLNIKKILTSQTLIWIMGSAGNLSLLFGYLNGRTRILETYKDEENIVNAMSVYNKKMIVPLLLAPLSLFALIGFFIRKGKLKKRLIPPQEPGNWVRQNRDEIKNLSDFLSKGKQKEESIKSVSYEIWKDQSSEKIKIVPWKTGLSNNFEICPKCNFITLNKPYVVTLRSATYSSTGLGKKVQNCLNCNFEQSFGTVILPKLVKSSSSSSGGGSSSSSSGSWGGGSSGGGGAGGSW